ncbi:hypothetical protein Ciccas_006454 [Cichlidogyrus casuarinus]|uniref:Uncharacterized protein n=1 Tax=Cichlidogyrus casuarinus TaxID=1844966 RepID=A0ABD2Q6V5_9PLAT
MNMTRPFNLTAFLYSQWLEDRSRILWEKEALPELQKLDLPKIIPPEETLPIDFVLTNILNPNFDGLVVYPADRYFISPGKNFYTPLVELLSRMVLTGKADKMTVFTYKNLKKIEQLYLNYKAGFERMSKALDDIKTNKYIMFELNYVMETVKRGLDQLRQMDERILIGKTTEIVIKVFLDLRDSIAANLSPFLYDMLLRVIPFPGVNTLYYQTLSPICPIPTQLRGDETRFNVFIAHNSLLQMFQSFSWNLSIVYLCIFISTFFVSLVEFLRLRLRNQIAI